jgi:hypothetical protein
MIQLLQVSKGSEFPPVAEKVKPRHLKGHVNNPVRVQTKTLLMERKVTMVKRIIMEKKV